MDDSNNQQSEQPKPSPQSKPWRHKNKHSSKKKWVTLGIIAAIIVVSAVFGWYIIYGQKTTTAPEIITRTTDEIQQIINNAETQLNSGDTSGAKSTYEKAIEQTSDAAQKSSLLMSSASLYYEEGNYDQALVLAKQAESYKLDENVASMTAEIYKMKGDKQNAIIYYQKSISLIDKTNSIDDSTLYYQNEIDALNGVGN